MRAEQAHGCKCRLILDLSTPPSLRRVFGFPCGAQDPAQAGGSFVVMGKPKFVPMGLPRTLPPPEGFGLGRGREGEAFRPPSPGGSWGPFWAAGVVFDHPNFDFFILILF
jgi:hypothetical protein